MNPVHAGQGYHQPPPQYYQGQPHPQPPNAAYGNVYYALNQGDNTTAYDSRKRIYDSVNAFFGDTKRRQFDPTSYAAIGQRLGGLQGLQLPINTGPTPEFQGMGGVVAVGAGGGGYGPALATQAYHLPPMSNARTKNDLLDLDRMLDTIHTTVYENDDHVAAAGIAQPGATYIHRMSHGTTHQTPPITLPSSHATATTGNMSNASALASTSPSTTPALTPPSSAVSYVSSHSPSSYSHRVSPPHHHQDDMAMYPRLPSTTAHEMAGAYTASTNAAPPSTLSNNFDYNDRRRWTGGVLERSRPDDYAKSPIDDMMEDGERTPTRKDAPEEGSSRESDEKFHSSLIDPALQEAAAASSSSPDPEAAKRTAQAATEAARKGEEAWLENVRILEQLRAYIKDRLSRGDYVEEGEETADADKQSHEASPSPAAAAADHMEGVEHSSKTTEEANKTTLSTNLAESSTTITSSSSSPSAATQSLYPTLKGVEDDENENMKME